MARYAAFLRGININNRRARNTDLIACLEEVGFEEPAVFRASGNLVFEAPSGTSAEKVAAKLEDGLKESLGFEVPVFLRNASRCGRSPATSPSRRRRSKPRRASFRRWLYWRRSPWCGEEEDRWRSPPIRQAADPRQRALLAAEFRHPGLGAGDEGHRRGDRAGDDDALTGGDDRTDRREVFPLTITCYMIYWRAVL